MGTSEGMHRGHSGHGDLVAMTLDAVIVAISAGRPRLLVVDREGQRPALPSGPLDADEDATLELAMRRLIRTQTGLEVGYVEQLYTFGDRDRGATKRQRRDISVAYLALVRETEPALDARWIDVYELLPWEDRRFGGGSDHDAQLRASLENWVGWDAQRQDRLAMT
ncbi:MAG: NUDIX domain-containing protein, partial [Intrasporangiaceae bacterium]|nr:NUDIX domain-containing protein [Intrasporangiaceae bacterium]